MTQRSSPLRTGVETSEVESVMIVVPVSSNDIHFSDCSSLLHAIIQQTQITIFLYMNKDANLVFQGVKSFSLEKLHKHFGE